MSACCNTGAVVKYVSSRSLGLTCVVERVELPRPCHCGSRKTCIRHGPSAGNAGLDKLKNAKPEPTIRAQDFFALDRFVPFTFDPYSGA